MTACVVTLVARPGDGADLAEAVAVVEADTQPTRIETLSEGEAIDLYFESGFPLDELRERLDSHLDGAPVDRVVQGTRCRRKRLLVADMDSTIIGQECIDELADMLGLKPQVAAITERAMRGEIPFEPALRERVALLAGLPLAQIDRVIAERIRLNPGAAALVRTMRAGGAHTVLVSGGFTLFTARVAAAAGFEESRANRLELDGDRLAGTVAEPILGAEGKLAALRELRGRLGLEAEETMAVGDGANDLAMIGEAGLGVAFHAKPKVAAAAAARIDRTGLTTLLFAQGYRRDEFAPDAAGAI